MRFSKNNKQMRNRDDSDRLQHFGIRKLTVGVASVILSTTFYLGAGQSHIVKADTNSGDDSSTVSTATDNGIHEKTYTLGQTSDSDQQDGEKTSDSADSSVSTDNQTATDANTNSTDGDATKSDDATKTAETIKAKATSAKLNSLTVLAANDSSSSTLQSDGVSYNRVAGKVSDFDYKTYNDGVRLTGIKNQTPDNGVLVLPAPTDFTSQNVSNVNKVYIDSAFLQQIKNYNGITAVVTSSNVTGSGQLVATDNENANDGNFTAGFKDNTNITYLDLTNLDITGVKRISSLFEGMTNLKQIDGLYTWDTKNIVNLARLFANDTSLYKGSSKTSHLNLSTWDLSNANENGSVDYIFEGVTDPTRIFVKDDVAKQKLKGYNSSISTSVTGAVNQTLTNSLILTADEYKQEVDNDKSTIQTYLANNKDGAAYDVINKYYTKFNLDQVGDDVTTSDRAYAEGAIALQILAQLTKITGDFNSIYLDKVTTKTGTYSEPAYAWQISKATFVAQTLVKNWAYKIDTDGNVTLDSYKGSSLDVVIPTVADFLAAGISGVNDNSTVSVSSTPLYQLTHQLGAKTITVSKTDTTKKVVYTDAIMPSTFSGDENGGTLESLDLSGLSTPNLTNLILSFVHQRKLKTINLSGWDTSKLTTISAAFMDDSALTTLIVDDWDTSNLTNMSNMLQGTTSLTNLDLSSWNTSKVDDMREMFADSGIQTLKISGSNFKIPNDINLLGTHNNEDMFKNTYPLLVIVNSDTEKAKTGTADGLTAGNATVSGDTNTPSITSSPALTADEYAAQVKADKAAVNTYLQNKNNGGYDLVKKYYDLFNLSSVPDTVNSSNFGPSAMALHTLAQLTQVKTNSGKVVKSITADQDYTTPADFMNATFTVQAVDMDWTFSVDNDGNVTLNSYIGQNKDVVIPTADDFVTAGVKGATADSKVYISSSVMKSLVTNDATSISISNTNADQKVIASDADWSNAFSQSGTSSAINNTLATVDLDRLDTSNITKLSYAFSYDRALTTVNVKGWDVSHVTDMSKMFYDTGTIDNLDLSTWNTADVINMSEMFYQAKAKQINLSGWSNNNVTDMSEMFRSSLANSIDLKNFKTNSVKNMRYMFASTANLQNINGISDLDVSNVTNMASMFDSSSLTSLDLSSWNTGKVTDMSGMFNSSKATNLKVFTNTQSVKNMSFMFASSSVTSLDLNSWDVSNVTDMSYMFNWASALKELRVSNWNTKSVTNMNSMFYRATSLTAIDPSNWDVSNVTDMSNMFYFTSSLKNLDLSNWNTKSVQTMYQMFWRYGLETLNISGDNFIIADNHQFMFNAPNNVDRNTMNPILVIVKDGTEKAKIADQLPALPVTINGEVKDNASLLTKQEYADQIKADLAVVNAVAPSTVLGSKGQLVSSYNKDNILTGVAQTATGTGFGRAAQALHALAIVFSYTPQVGDNQTNTGLLIPANDYTVNYTLKSNALSVGTFYVPVTNNQTYKLYAKANTDKNIVDSNTVPILFRSSSVTWTTAPDTTKANTTGTAYVKITNNKGDTSYILPVTYTVLPSTSADIDSYNMSTTKGSYVLNQELTDADAAPRVTNAPSDVTITWDKKPNTSKLGNGVASVKITFGDNTSTTMDVPYYVSKTSEDEPSGETIKSQITAVAQTYDKGYVITDDDAKKAVTNVPAGATITWSSKPDTSVATTDGVAEVKVEFADHGIRYYAVGYTVVDKDATSTSDAATTLTVKNVTYTQGDQVQSGMTDIANAVFATSPLPTNITNVEWTKQPDTTQLGSDVAEVKVTYTDSEGKSQTKLYDIPYTVNAKPSHNDSSDDADKSNVNVQTPKYNVGDTPQTSDVVTNLPQGAVATWGVKPDTSKATDKGVGSVVVTFADGSTRTYPFAYTVVDPNAQPVVSDKEADKHNLTTIAQYYRLHDVVPDDVAGDVFTEKLPENASASWLVKPDTSTLGAGIAKVTVSYQDGSSKTYNVIYVVNDNGSSSDVRGPEADSSELETKPLSYKVGDEIGDAAKAFTTDLPAGASASWVVKPDTSAPVDNSVASVRVTFADKSERTYRVNYSVTNADGSKVEDSTGLDLTVKTVTYTQGDEVENTSDAIVAKVFNETLKSGYTASWKVAPTTETTGSRVATVQITDSTGKVVKEYKVAYTVNAKKTETTPDTRTPNADDSQITVNAQTYKVGDEAPTTGVLNNVPDDATVAWVKAPDTSSETQNGMASIRVTFADKGTRTYEVPYVVTKADGTSTPTGDGTKDADTATLKTKSLTYTKGDAVGDAKDAFTTNLPEGASAEWVTEPNTNVVGSGVAQVLVTFSDQSTKQYAVSYTVNNKKTENPDSGSGQAANAELTVKGLEYKLNDPIGDPQSVFNEQLPDGATASWLVEPDTSSVTKNGIAKVVVYFADNGVRSYDVNYTVVDDSATKPSTGTKAETTTLTPVPQNYKLGDPIPEDQTELAKLFKETLPSGANVYWVTKPDTSKVGSGTAIVEVKFDDGSSAKYTIAYNVNVPEPVVPGEQTEAAQSTLKTKAMTYKVGDDASSTDVFTTALPTGAKAQWLIEPDTSVAKNNGIATILVTFSDDSTRTYNVNYSVTDTDGTKPTDEDTGLSLTAKSLSYTVGDPIGEAEDAIEGMPEGATASWKTKPTTDTTGSRVAVVEVTYNGKTQDVKVAYTVTAKEQTDSHTGDAEESQITVNPLVLTKGQTVTDDDAKKTLNNVPAGAKVEWLVKPNTNKVTNDGKAMIKVTFADGSVRNYPVSYQVVDETGTTTPTGVPAENLTPKTLNFKEGDEVGDPSDAFTTELPEGVTAEWTKKPDTGAIGHGVAEVTVHYTDAQGNPATKTYEIPYVVNRKDTTPETGGKEADLANLTTKSPSYGVNDQVPDDSDSIAKSIFTSDLPAGATVAWKVKPDTTKPTENGVATATVTFSDGSTRDYKVTYQVTDPNASTPTTGSEADKHQLETKPLNYNLGDSEGEASAAFTNLPAGATAEFVTHPDTSTIGSRTVVVKVTYSQDGSSKEYVVTYNVNAGEKGHTTGDEDSDAYKSSLSPKALDYKVGDQVGDASTAFDPAFPDANAKTYTWIKKPNTNVPVENATASVRVDFADGSSRIYFVNYNVEPTNTDTTTPTTPSEELNLTVKSMTYTKGDQVGDASSVFTTALPTGAVATWTKKPDTSVVGSDVAEVKVSYQGKDYTYKVAYNVNEPTNSGDKQDNISDELSRITVNAPTYKLGDTPTLDGILNNVPDGAKVEWVTEPDTTKETKNGMATIKVTKGDDSIIINVPYVVTKPDGSFTPTGDGKTEAEKSDLVTKSIAYTQGDEVGDAKDVFTTELPEGATAVWVTKPNTDELGSHIAKVVVYYSDGSSNEYKVAYTVAKKLSDAEKSTIVPKTDVTFNQGDDPKPEDVLTNVPEGSKVDWKDGTKPDTSKSGKGTATVVVTFPDGSTKEFDVPYTVVSDADKSTIVPKTDVTFNQGDNPKPEDVLTNVPEGSKVEWKDGTKPDTSKSGKGTATVVVTYPDGSTKEFEVPYTVVSDADKSKVAPKTDVTFNQGDNPKPEDVLTNVPEGSKVEWKDGTKPDTSKSGKGTATVVVTYPDGSTKEFEVPYTVVSQADKSKVAPKDNVTHKQGDKPGNAKDVLKDLPAGSKVDWTKKPNTSKPGKGTAEVKVTFPDGSEKTITVSYTTTKKGKTKPGKGTNHAGRGTGTGSHVNTTGTTTATGTTASTSSTATSSTTTTKPSKSTKTAKKQSDNSDLLKKLTAKIAQGKSLDLKDVPADVKAELESALNEGADVLNDKNASKKDIEDAIQKIQDAIDKAKASKTTPSTKKTAKKHQHTSQLDTNILIGLVALGLAGWWLIIFFKRRREAVDFQYNEVPSVDKVMQHLGKSGAATWAGKAPDTTKVGKGKVGHLSVNGKKIKFSYNVLKSDEQN